MDDFGARPGEPNTYDLLQGEKNAIAPGKRPLSSMVPTIILKDGKPFLVLGSPGGSTIPTAVLQVIINVIDFHMNVQDAVDFPRIHHQWKPDRLECESGVSPDTISLLKQMGYSVEQAHSRVLPRVGAILLSEGWLQGANDDRSSNRSGGDGKAAGY